LCEIFPKVQIHRYNGRDEIGKKGQKYLLGIGFVQNLIKTDKIGLPELPVDTVSFTGLPSELPKNTGNPVGNSLGNSQTLTQSAGNPGNSISLPFAEVCNFIAHCTDADRQKLIELLSQPQPLPEKITPEDAQVMRDIALVWWLEYYPEQMQALMTQMYGWQAPGTKYDVATLAEWLEREDDLIRDRITELIHRRRG
jgi:hypothetical protein